jgi:hypothetical protein
MNLHMWYIHLKDTLIFMIVHCIMMLQLSSWSIWEYCKHNFSFMCSYRLCQENILRHYVAGNGGVREWSIGRRDTCIVIQT